MVSNRYFETMLFAILLAVLLPLRGTAQKRLRLWPMAEDVRVARQADGKVSLSFLLLPRQLTLSRAHVLIVEPWLCSTERTDSVRLPSVGIYGRNVYYHVVRRGFSPFQNQDDVFIYARAISDTIAYAEQLPAAAWMAQGADVRLHYYLMDGCSEVLDELVQQATSPTAASVTAGHAAQQQYTALAGRTAADALSPAEQEPAVLKKHGRAYVDFRVGSTVLEPGFHDNARELQRIRLSLDSIIADTTAVITHFAVCGYASPEGGYENNMRLASGRSETLSRYISETLGVPRGIMETSFVAEDWAGLRQYVERQAWPTKDAILQLIDTVDDPDRRLLLIQQRYPREYDDIKVKALPYLRHSDYTIDYEYLLPTERRLSPYSVPGMPVAVTVAVEDTADAAMLAAPQALWPEAPFEPVATDRSFHTYSPLLALKSNLLFDAALTPNVEVEVPFGRGRRWSIMVEDWFPWFRFSHNEKGDASPYYRSDQRPTRHSYQVWTLGAELRYWLAPRCSAARPLLSGTFLGIYGAGGKYDVEHRSEGYQGEFTSFGLTIGHSWALSRHWNLELSVSGGYVGGPQRHYEAEFDDARLIFRNKDHLRYVGPTKLKLSLAWIIGSKAKKGGEQ